jgi:hypothetical protein
MTVESHVYSHSHNVFDSACIERPNGDYKMSGYTIEEKVEIARQHLLPRQLKNMV